MKKYFTRADAHMASRPSKHVQSSIGTVQAEAMVRRGCFPLELLKDNQQQQQQEKKNNTQCL